MIEYRQILNVAVQHNYHRGGLCRCLDFRPTSETCAAIDRADLLLRKTLHGIELLGNTSRVDALRSMAQDEAEAMSFDFRVHATDPEFRSYTEPFTDAVEAMLYFDNRALDGRGEHSLSAGEFASAADLRPLDAAEFDGVLTPRDRLLPPEFVLRLYAGSGEGSLLDRWPEAGSTAYRIGFVSRSRHWKYYLLGKMINNGSAGAYFIADADQRIEFESGGEQFLSGRKRAWTFRSKQRIPLHENYRFRFQLKQKTRSGETVIIPTLPFASIGQVGRETIAEQETTVSEIYINS